MKYTIYKITHKESKKIYIGKHQTKDLNDGYMGSGKYIKRAQIKHSIDSFVKEILHVFDTEEEMNAKEAEIVSEEFCLREDTYNLCVGGKGGFSYIHRMGLSDPSKGRKATDIVLEKKYGSEWRTIISQRGVSKMKEILEKDPNFLSDRSSRSFLGKHHTKESKRKISEKAKERLKDPTQNSQFGTIWITDGKTNKKITSSEVLPNNWYRGRVFIKK